MIEEPVVKPAQVLGQQGDFEQEVSLRLAARQLHRRHRFVRHLKVEAPAGRLPVDVKVRRAVTGGGPQWVLGGPPLGLAQTQGVIADFGRETTGPQRHRARHGLLHVGVARQFDRPVARRQVIECIGDRDRPAIQRLGGITQIQSQCGQHLIVA